MHARRVRAGFPGNPSRLSPVRMPMLMLASLLACGGCRTVPAPVAGSAAGQGTEVDMAMLLPPAGAARMELPREQGFVFPVMETPAAMPAYPRALLADRLPAVEVCVEIDISREGTVAAARPREDADCPALQGDGREAFLQVSLSAVRQWRYVPALVCTAPDAVDEPCRHPQAVEQPTAVRLSYAFRFTQHDGAPLVELEAGR